MLYSDKRSRKLPELYGVSDCKTNREVVGRREKRSNDNVLRWFPRDICVHQTICLSHGNLMNPVCSIVLG
jgi:hypothetical protein